MTLDVSAALQHFLNVLAPKNVLLGFPNGADAMEIWCINIEYLLQTLSENTAVMLFKMCCKVHL